jgi:sulfatase modifying factor 1
MRARHAFAAALALVATGVGCEGLLQGTRANAPQVAPSVTASAPEPPCPAGMAHVETFCVDLWEDHVVELDDAGNEREHSPYERVEGKKLRAKTAPDVVPQAYISLVEASGACARAGKRLCSSQEFIRACRGPDANDWYPYLGHIQQSGYCNVDRPNIGIQVLYGNNPGGWTMDDFNDPRLNQLPKSLSKTGAFPRCVSPDGAFDMVGNLHEWVDDPEDNQGHARFRGGWYGEATLNGPGCLYVTMAHEQSYHDYSVGFRCCKDAFD